MFVKSRLFYILSMFLMFTFLFPVCYAFILFVIISCNVYFYWLLLLFPTWYICFRFFFFKFSDLQHYNNTVFSKSCSYISYMFKSTSVINKGGAGRYLVIVLEISKMLKNLAIRPQAQISHFGISKSHKDQTKNNKKQNRSKHTYFCPYRPAHPLSQFVAKSFYTKQTSH